MLGKDLGNGTPGNVSTEVVYNVEDNSTNPTREYRFIVDVALHPGHQMFNVCWSRHFCRTLEVLGILPQILEPIGIR